MKRFNAVTLFAIAATSMAGFTACGSAGQTALPGSSNAGTIYPSSTALDTGQQMRFEAPDATSAPSWSVVEPAGGVIDRSGSYTAPDTEGTFHVAAKYGTTAYPRHAEVRVKRGVRVAVTPQTASVVAGASMTFTASVSGATNTGVTWSVSEGAAGGAVTSAGVYTASSTAGTYHVVATSVADATRSNYATVTVSAPVTTPPPPAAISVALSPTTASVAAGGTAQFTATVSGSSNTAVTWSVQEGSAGGSVSTSGLYTAPSTAGTYHVVATSSADSTQTATSTVTVAAPVTTTVVSIAISPTTASVKAGGTQQFAATISGSTNTAATWAVQEGSAGGTISAAGLYTAPSAAGTYHVVATSAADTSKTASATLSVTAPVIDPTLRTVQGWQNLFDQSWDSENAYYLPKTQSTHSFDHYNAAYGLDGLTAMFEATGNTKYLDQALVYVNNVIATAVPSSSLSTSQFKDSYMAWPAYDNEGNLNEQALYESYYWRYVTKMLRAMHDNATVYANSNYKAQYDTILAFAKKNLWQKWHSRGDNSWIYRETTYMAAHWAFICLDLWALSSDATERATYMAVVDNINLHLPNYPGNSIRGQLSLQGTRYFWNDFFGSFATPGSESDHGNGLISYLAEAHDQHVEWTDADMSAFSQTLLQELWPAPGVYYTYVDGTVAGDGWFDDGYCKLGRYNSTIQKRLEQSTVGLGFQLYGNGALNAKILNGG